MFANIFTIAVLLTALCFPGVAAAATKDANADDFTVVHCLLPGQVRQLGQRTTYVSPRKPARLPAAECRKRGGEYALGNAPTAALHPTRLWGPAAEQGDTEAQAMLGRIYELGEGVPQNLQAAAQWYARAAQQDNQAAMVSLANLLEQGLPGSPDPQADRQQASAWYQRAAGTDQQTSLETAPNNTSGYDATLAGPTITLIEPTLPNTRGLVKVTSAPLPSGDTLVGRVDAAAGLMRLTINGQAVTWNNAGVFQHAIDSSQPDVAIVAIDQQGHRADLSFRWVQTDLEPADPAPVKRRWQVDFGSYHALLIANSRYDHMPALRTPDADIRAIQQVLENKFGFQVTTVHNASRYELMSALNNMRKDLGDDANLLIYYAGHGELESTNMRGHWLPVDAELDSTANWVSNVAITDMLNLIAARKLLVVADSCYSGTLTRSSISRLDPNRNAAAYETWLQSMAAKKSRVVLSSGGVAPVMDEGGGAHSVFAKAFLEALQSHDDVLSGRELYQALAARVTYAADAYNFEQVPQYAPIARAGHESGDFFFVPSDSSR